MEYQIKLPYSIPSDPQGFTVAVQRRELQADYRYLAVPRVSPRAYLQAELTDWRSLQLLEGQVNLYFENSYVGKTLLNLQQEGDTLQLSLGQDAQVQVRREKVRDRNNKNFIGSRRQALVGYQYACTNGKRVSIPLRVTDQVPVSGREEIEVELKTRNGAQVDESRGLLHWDLELDPGESRTLRLEYEVAYPKHKTIYLE